MPKLLSVLKRISHSPVETFIEKSAQLAPQFAHERLSRKAQQIGIKKLQFILSFDCDTEKDIEVIPQVHEKLRSLGITPIYAVPGELLEIGAQLYRGLSDEGCEFLNHGYKIHTVLLNANHYHSTLFYDQMSSEDVAEDIRRGHEAHLKILGKAPAGFRVPHFGSYQKPSQLNFLYRQLCSLNYRFSSSTAPLAALRRGPLQKTKSGLFEIPVCGTYLRPGEIIDSWSYRYAPGALNKDGAYINAWRELLDFYLKRPGLLNTYVDPSQVYDWPEFFDAMKLLAPYSLASYNQLLEGVEL